MTKIEWTKRPNSTGKTWNPMRARNKKTGGVGHFCEKVSPGCKNCYAETFQKRFRNPVRYAAQDADQVEVFLDQKTLVQPIGWKKPATIFVCSQTDLFLHHYSDEWINQVFAVMALCPQHTFIILTKRYDRMKTFLRTEDRDEAIGYRGYEIAEEHGGDTYRMPALIHRGHAPRGSWPLPNVWLGVSVEDQKAADERIPVLLHTPAAVRFLSVEPLLSEVDLSDILDLYQPLGGGWDAKHPCGQPAPGIDWVIVGGESGHNARPMHPDWARTLRDQCKAAGVPFFFKQHGSWLPWEPDDAPFWKSQADDYHDGHTLFPADMDTNSKWADGLDFALDGQDHVVFQRVGKKAAGRLLDGVEHNEWPEVKSC